MVLSRTQNRYQERINLALVHIQNNINKALTLDRLAEVSSVSPFHFHRIFKACVGETLNQHIKRIRLEQAAFRLRFTRESVSHIAEQCGYASLASFTKAFGQQFAMAPTQFRQQRPDPISTKPAWPEMNQSLRLPEYEFHEFNRQKVLFVRRTGRYDLAAQEAWNTLVPYTYAQNLNHGDSRHIGITYDNPAITDEDLIRYEACITVADDVDGQGEIGTQYLGAGRYCVFHYQGPYHELWRTYEAIYSIWLREFEGQLANAASFAIYHNHQSASEQKMIDICIPVLP